MARSPRTWRPGTGHHLISRFVDRDFRIIDETGRNAYLTYAADATTRWDWRILSYALMSSHIHWAALAGLIAPDRFFRSVHTRYGQYHHRRYGSLGPVFADRPKSHEIAE